MSPLLIFATEQHVVFQADPKDGPHAVEFLRPPICVIRRLEGNDHLSRLAPFYGGWGGDEGAGGKWVARKERVLLSRLTSGFEGIGGCVSRQSGCGVGAFW